MTAHNALRRAKARPFVLQSPVGAGQMNRAADLRTTRDALARHGLCRPSLRGLASDFKPDLENAIRLFQRQIGLEPDGIVAPEDPTALALGTSPRPLSVRRVEGVIDEATCRLLAWQIANTELTERDNLARALEQDTIARGVSNRIAALERNITRILIEAGVSVAFDVARSPNLVGLVLALASQFPKIRDAIGAAKEGDNLRRKLTAVIAEQRRFEGIYREAQRELRFLRANFVVKGALRISSPARDRAIAQSRTFHFGRSYSQGVVRSITRFTPCEKALDIG